MPAGQYSKGWASTVQRCQEKQNGRATQESQFRGIFPLLSFRWVHICDICLSNAAGTGNLSQPLLVTTCSNAFSSTLGFSTSSLKGFYCSPVSGKARSNIKLQPNSN